MPSAAISELRRCYLRDFEVDGDDESSQLDDLIDQDSENARSLARRILEDLGFY